MKSLNTHRALQVIRWISPQFHFFVFWYTAISRYLINEREMRLSQITLFLLVDPVKSDILPPTRQLIQRKSIDRHSRKAALCLNFSSLNKSQYGSASVSHSIPIAWKALRMLDSIIVCLKSWYTFIMNVTVSFSSSNGNWYLVHRLRTPKKVTSRTWKIWVVCCVWRKSYHAHSCLGEKTDDMISDMTWHDSDNCSSITLQFLQRIHPTSGVQRDWVSRPSRCNQESFPR
jgi:hypothetical protein